MQNDMIKLSIITINLNNRVGLRKTVESVIQQVFTDYEYIIIDGGSTDGSIEVIKEFEDKISYWVSEPDKGIYNAMNKGIMKANGEYLHFLNSGDWLVDSYVYRDVFKENPVHDIIYGNLIKKYPGDKSTVDKGIGGKEITFLSLYMGNLNHPASLIKRSLFTKYGLYDESLRIVSDWKFFLETLGLHKSTVLYTDRNISCFDMSGICNTQKELLLSEREKVLGEMVPLPILSDYREFSQELYWIRMIKKQKLTALLYKITKKLLSRKLIP